MIKKFPLLNSVTLAQLISYVLSHHLYLATWSFKSLVRGTHGFLIYTIRILDQFLYSRLSHKTYPNEKAFSHTRSRKQLVKSDWCQQARNQWC
jgi:hypothetical protein